MTRTYTLLLVLLVSLRMLNAQSTAGTEFWLGYMENLNLAFNDQPAFSIIINANTATSGSIDVPATGLTLPFAVAAGTTEIFLPDAIFYSDDSEQIDNKGIRITADTPVQVQAFHYRLYFSESTHVLPTTELGTDYLVTTMIEGDGALHPASLVIVATADNTEIEVTPSAITLGLRPAGLPFTITLDEGENYQIQALGELTGTRVRSVSGQAIAVFSGAQQANIFDGTCTGGADSHVWDQSLPLDDWRDLYYFVPFSGQGGDRIRILSTSENTRVFFDCEEVAVLDIGEFYEDFLTAPTVISSTEAISVTQYTNGFSCEPSQLGDPNGLSYLPADFRGNSFRWYASGRPNALADSGRHFDRHFVTIIGPAEATTNVQVDGDAVNGFLPFPANPDWEYAQVQVNAGTHEVTASEAIQVYSYGFGFADSYTNHLGYTQRTPEAFACLEIEREGVLCVDSLQLFTYTSNLDLVDFFWDFGDGGSSTLSEPAYTYDDAGIYEVTLTATDATGLVLTATLEFTVIDCEDDPCASENAALIPMVEGTGCALYAQNFSYTAAVEALTVEWDFGDGSASVSGEAASHFYQTAGTYTATITITTSLGCVFTETFEVIITDCDPCFDSGIVDLFVDAELCAGELLTFSSGYEAIGIPTFELQWSFSDGQTFSELEPTVSFATPGDYTVDFFLVNQFGCLYTGNLVFTIIECGADCTNLPPLTIFGPTEVCVDTALFYIANTTAELVSYSWSAAGQTSLLGLFGLTFDTPGLNTVSLTALDAAGCVYTAEFEVAVEDCPEDCAELFLTGISYSGEPCQDSVFSITANYESNIVAEEIWIITPSDLSFVEGTVLTQDFFPEAGDYELYFIAEQLGSGCFVDTTFTITFEECAPDCALYTIGAVQVEGPICVDSLLTITANFSNPPDSLSWLISGAPNVEENPFDVRFFQPGPRTINLQAFWDNGCTADTSLTLTIEDCPPQLACEIMLPNIFSPNNDGINDGFRAFFAEACEPTAFSLEIYNRWGGQVYQSNNPNEQWNGRFNGKPHPQDVLIYWCQATFPDGTIIEKKGDVTLLR